MTDFNSQLQRMKDAVQSGQGTNRSDRNTCHFCGRRILAGKELVTTAGHSFHREHFQCSTCHKALSTDAHYYSEGQYFCPDCWKTHCPVCAKCGEPITSGSKINAMGKVWHEDHFRCTECNCPLEGSFAVRNDKPYCPAHANAAVAGMNCVRCHKPITAGVYFNSKDGSRHWHENCFVCASCKMPFKDRSHYELDGEVYCQLHYHTKKGSICFACGLPVIGDALEVKGMVWHTNCLKCAVCGKSLKGVSFNMRDDKPHCPGCIIRP